MDKEFGEDRQTESLLRTDGEFGKDGRTERVVSSGLTCSQVLSRQLAGFNLTME